MDEEGWVPVEQLLDALHREEKWQNIFEADVKEMIEKFEKNAMNLQIQYPVGTSESVIIF